MRELCKHVITWIKCLSNNFASILGKVIFGFICICMKRSRLYLSKSIYHILTMMNFTNTWLHNCSTIWFSFLKADYLGLSHNTHEVVNTKKWRKMLKLKFNIFTDVCTDDTRYLVFLKKLTSFLSSLISSLSLICR